MCPRSQRDSTRKDRVVGQSKGKTVSSKTLVTEYTNEQIYVEGISRHSR